MKNGKRLRTNPEVWAASEEFRLKRMVEQEYGQELRGLSRAHVTWLIWQYLERGGGEGATLPQEPIPESLSVGRREVAGGWTILPAKGFSHYDLVRNLIEGRFAQHDYSLESFLD